MSRAAKHLGTVLAGRIRDAAQARWLTRGTVTQVDPPMVRLDDELVAVALVGNYTPVLDDVVLLAVLRGTPSVGYAILGPLDPPPATVPPAVDYTRFSWSADAIYDLYPYLPTETLTTWQSDQHEELVSLDSYDEMHVIDGASGRHAVQVSGGDLSDAIYFFAPATDGRDILAGGGFTGYLVAAIPVAASGGQSAVGLAGKMTFGIYGSPTSGQVSGAAHNGDNSVQASWDYAIDTTALHVYEFRVDADGAVHVWIDGADVTPDTITYYPTAGVPQPLTNSNAGRFLINQGGPTVEIYEVVFVSRYLVGDELAGERTRLLTRYGL